MDKAIWDDLVSLLERDPLVGSFEPDGEDVVLAFGESVRMENGDDYWISYEFLEFFVGRELFFGVRMTGSFITDTGAELNASIDVVSVGHVAEIKSLFSNMSRLPGIGPMK